MMIYIENIFICLTAPLLVAFLCTRGMGRKMMLFVLGGMSMCLLSSYINTYAATVYGTDYITASIAIAPVVEETMKLLPILFFLLVFEPSIEHIPAFVIAVATGFATFENVCFLAQNGSSQLTNLLIRGFGTGVMHVTCGVIISVGLITFWGKRWLRAAGTLGLLSAAITYHGIYNMLVLQPKGVAYVGYLIPLFSIGLYYFLHRILWKRS